jgi:hypothetical protein
MIADHDGTASVLDYAIAYNRQGLSTIPVKTDGTKMPDVSSWREYAETRPSELQVKSWFATGDRGIAIIHGEVSGGTEVTDLDHGDLLDPFVERLDHACPGLYQKLCVIQTPRPGNHIVYRCDTVEGNQKLARRPASAEEIAAAEAKGEKAGPVTLIETRGRNGYTLAPGSPAACHETGRTYQHVEGPGLDNLQRITPEEREAILWAARSLDQMPVEEPKLPEVTHNGRAYDGESPGDAYARTVTFADILEPHGWDCVGASGDRLLWRRPGKTEGISATTGNVSKQGNELLCVFSTNAHPFDGPDGSRQCSTHSKFDAYARLNHGGDYSAAAKELARLGYGDKPRLPNVDIALRDDAGADVQQREPRKPVEVLTLGQLVRAYPELRPPVVDGLFRKGETCNVIAASKVGKSWLTYGLALSIINNEPWLGRFDVTPGRVLLIDNELHRETLANRIPAVARAMGITMDSINDDLHVVTLRGDHHTLKQLSSFFESIEPGKYQAIILDAKYRFMPEGADENGNGPERETYDLIDRFAVQTDSAFVLVHHASKGDQSGKATTDVGAGAGAQSRAADSHLVLRQHEEDGAAVLDAAIRSFAPIDPVTIRWAFPLWIADARLDPNKLAGRMGKGQQVKAAEDAGDMQRIVEALEQASEPLTRKRLRKAVGIGDDRLQRLLDRLESDGRVASEEATIRGNTTEVYTPCSGVVDDVDGPRSGHVVHGQDGGVGGPIKNRPVHVPPRLPMGGPGEESYQDPSTSLIGEEAFHDYTTGVAP